ncbi:uncharacterized protein LOC141613589 [Silene latifolia]|uniref:uncharacterized protein LOC141613589 n=1 Tax=Silene latifolia TaxID=37657 RepID=UPI003D783DE0
MGEMGSGMGMVIQDFDDKVERAGVVQVYEKWTPEIAEGKAAEFGLRTARQMGLQNVELESDSMTLINMLRAKSFPLNYFGRISRTVLDIANSFSCIKFNFTRRNGNAVAHGIAHLLPLSYSTWFWVEIIPETIAPLVLLDSFDLPS